MSIPAYLENLPANRRLRFESILALIRSLYPGAVASMRYKMPTFEQGDGWVSVANQKHYISLYTCSPEHIADFKRRHPKIKTGKGCINFKDSDDIPHDDLEAVIRSAMEQKKRPQS